MEAYPPGSDQLPSWENRTLRSTPDASRGYATQRSESERRKERTPFDITLGSNLIQFEFSYLFTFPFIPICLAGCGLFSSGVIFYHKGESNNTLSCITVSVNVDLPAFIYCTTERRRVEALKCGITRLQGSL